MIWSHTISVCVARSWRNYANKAFFILVNSPCFKICRFCVQDSVVGVNKLHDFLSGLANIINCSSTNCVIASPVLLHFTFFQATIMSHVFVFRTSYNSRIKLKTQTFIIKCECSTKFSQETSSYIYTIDVQTWTKSKYVRFKRSILIKNCDVCRYNYYHR